MNLSYYLDLKSLCNANTKQMEFFFQLAFDILAESQNFSDSLFEESFIRDDDDDVLLLNHKSGQSLYEVGSINSIFYFLHKAAEPFNCLEQDNLA